MKYRSEIDGLRAVAVVPVILFHAGLSVLPGGFVGVDVFFVISGYLITTILIEDRRKGSYSLAKFYERRARRILPALFLVMAACIPFALLWMPPYELQTFARSMAFASFFVSNFHFLENVRGYFTAANEYQPLLHTWSLGVEEQFYLVFPLLLGLVLKGGKRVAFGAIAVLAVLSLAVAEWGWRNHPAANFYFTPSRFWELMAGALCALWLVDRKVEGREIPAALGLVMIGAAAVAYGAGTPFPSVYTLLPVGGTVLVILFAGPGTVAGRLLSLGPVVGIGLVSYSAYLWHQPLFAFARIRSFDPPSDALMIVLAGLSFVLAALTWRFVERPFRQRPAAILPGRARLLWASGGVTVLFFAVGMAGFMGSGFPARLDLRGDSPLRAALASLDERPEYQTCSELAQTVRPEDVFCTAFAPEGAEEAIAVIGDSYAISLLPAFETVAAERPVRVLAGTHPGCPPILGVYTSRSRKDELSCHGYTERLAEALRAEGVAAVFLVGRWTLYTGPVYAGANPRYFLAEELNGNRGDMAQSRAVFEAAVDRTIEFYRDAGIAVFLVTEVPEQKVTPKLLLEKLILTGHGADAEVDTLIANTFVNVPDNDAIQQYVLDVFTARQAEGVHVVELPLPFMVEGRYIWYLDGRPLYHDSGHISLEGARGLRGYIRDTVEAELPGPGG